MGFIWNTIKSGKAKFSVDKLLWEGDRSGSVDLFKQIYRCDLLEIKGSLPSKNWALKLL